MESIRRKLSLFLLVQLMLTAYIAAASDRGVAIYAYGTSPIYKFTDGKGNITYSASSLNDFVQVEKVAISAPPSQQQLDESKQRFIEMKIAADKFNDARAERDTMREKNTLKRLQRLALINKAKPPVVTREFIYPTHPYHFKRKYVHGGRTSGRLHRRDLSLPPSSFSRTFH